MTNNDKYLVRKDISELSLSDGSDTLGDLIKKEEDVPRKKKVSVKKIGDMAAKILSDRQYQIFLSFYVFEMSAADISRAYDITEVRVGKILKQIAQNFNRDFH